MQDLIDALTIFLKYDNPKWPTHCEHDKLYVLVDPTEVSEEDITKLESLGFSADTKNRNFYSFRFGSYLLVP